MRIQLKQNLWQFIYGIVLIFITACTNKTEQLPENIKLKEIVLLTEEVGEKTAMVEKILSDIVNLAKSQSQSPIIIKKFHIINEESFQKELPNLLKDNKIFIGPVSSKSTKLIKNYLANQESDIVIFSLTNDQDAMSRNIFPMGLYQLEILREVLDYSTSSMQIGHYYNLLPDNKSGIEIANKIEQVLTRNSANLKNNYFYDNAGEKIKHIIQEIANQINIQPEITKFGLVVAESNSKILELIYNSLNEAKILDKIQLISTRDWLYNKFLNNKFAENSIFASSDYEKYRNFETIFHKKYGYKPPKFATSAYDAFLLIEYLNSSEYGYKNEYLYKDSGFIGVDGIFRLQYNGFVARNLGIYQIYNGDIKILKNIE